MTYLYLATEKCSKFILQLQRGLEHSLQEVCDLASVLYVFYDVLYQQSWWWWMVISSFSCRNFDIREPACGTSGSG